MPKKTIFSATVSSMEQAQLLCTLLTCWSVKQNKIDWQAHGFYLTFLDQSSFLFNFFVDNQSGTSRTQKEEVLQIIRDAGFPHLSIFVKTHPAE